MMRIVQQYVICKINDNENMPMHVQYTDIFKVVKNENFQ